MDNVNFPQALKALKTQLKISDKAFADMLKVSPNSLYNWYRGKTTPTGERREKLLEEMKKLRQNPKSNSAISQLASNSASESKPELHSRVNKRYKAKKLSRSAMKPKKSEYNEQPEVVVDKNLLKTYYTQLAAEKKKRTFHVEVEGLKKKHTKELTPEQWAELMMMIEEI